MLTLSTVSTSGRESEVTDSPPLAMAVGLTAFTMARDQLSLTELESLSIPVPPPASEGQLCSGILVSIPFTILARDQLSLTELESLSIPVSPPASGGQPPLDILPFTTARDLLSLTELVLLSTPSE